MANWPVVELDYDGVRLGNEMTKEFVEDMIQRFKDGKKLHRKYVYQIIIKAKEVFYNEPTMPEVTIEQGKKMTVCGDTHGTVTCVGLYVLCGGYELTQRRRTILRPPRDLQPQWLPLRDTRIPLQRRLRRPRLMVDRDRTAPLQLQAPLPNQLLPEPR